jgi:effector-binding domain-containing protein
MVTSAHLRSSFDIQEIVLEPQRAAVVHGTVYAPDISAFLGRAFSRVSDLAETSGAQLTGPPIARYTVGTGTFDVTAGFPVDRPLPWTDGVESAELPGGPALRIVYVGAYDGIAPAYQAGEAWLAAHHKAHRGDPWESYLDDPDVEQPRTAVYMPFGEGDEEHRVPSQPDRTSAPGT